MKTGRRRWASKILASFRLHGTTVPYPGDANQTAKLVAATADLEGISYLRATRW